jgi:hypothetical protein
MRIKDPRPKDLKVLFPAYEQQHCLGNYYKYRLDFPAPCFPRMPSSASDSYQKYLDSWNQDVMSKNPSLE